MPKPIANAKAFNGSIMNGFLFAMQAGTSTGGVGLNQMVKVTFEQLQKWILKGMGKIAEFRGEFSSALPEAAAVNDYFYASATFTSGGKTFTQGHFYMFNGTTWSDISGVLSQYAQQSDYLALKDAVDALEGGQIDPVVLFDGTKETYDRVMRSWFVSKGALTATAAELTALCDEWYTITRIGWNGYTTFYQPSESQSSSGTKGGDNSGKLCTPSTDTTKNRDDYEGLPLFAIKDCNWTIDSTSLEIVITAIDGITSNFKRNDPDVFVGVLQMAPYHWYDNKATTYTHGISDVFQSGHDFCKPVPEAVRPSTSDKPNQMRPWVCHSKYVSGVNGSKFTSCSNVTPRAEDVSHNSSQTYAHNIGSQYSGMCACDRDWLIFMFYIKYASLTADGILQGCCSYYRNSGSYVTARAETGVKRILMTSGAAADFLVGSTIRVGTSNSYGSSASYSLSGRAGWKILSKETVTVDGESYVALNVDADTAFDTTAGLYVTSWHWRTGSCDAVLGNDGSPNSATNGQNPARIQGIEYMMGAYEILSDTILSLYRADESYWYDPYVVNKASNQTTSITANYKAMGLPVGQPASSAWKYPKKLSFNGDNFFYEQIEGSSLYWLKDGFYMLAATEGVREWLLFGYLRDGAGAAGMSTGNGDTGLSRADWNVAGRLSPNGNRGEWAA